MSRRAVSTVVAVGLGMGMSMYMGLPPAIALSLLTFIGLMVYVVARD